PLDVLEGQGVVEAEGDTQLGLGLVARHRAEHRAGDVARRQMHQQEDENRDAEQDRQDRRDPGGDGTPHLSRPFLSKRDGGPDPPPPRPLYQPSIQTVEKSNQSLGGLTKPLTLGAVIIGCMSSTTGMKAASSMISLLAFW